MEPTDLHARTSRGTRKAVTVDGQRKPLYRHITDTLRERILTGVWAEDDALPSRRALAKELGTTHITIDKAVSQLVKEGLLSATIGSGTYVRRRSETTSHPKRQDRRRMGVVLGSATFNPQDAAKARQNYYFGEVLRGIQDAVFGMDVDVNYFGGALQNPDSLTTGEFDGLLLISPSLFDIEAVRHYATKIKMVAIGISSTVTPDDRMLPCVDSDNEDAAYRATRHLIDLGHKSIGYVNLSMHQANLFDRHRGFMRAMEEADLTINPRHLLLYPRFDPIAYPNLVDEWITKWSGRSNRPSALLVLDFAMSMTVLPALDKNHIAVPDDLSVVTFDDRLELEYHSPPITAIRQPIYELGKRGAQRLLEALTNDGERLITGTELLPGELIVRGSTRPA